SVIFFFQAEDGIRVYKVTGVQTCALPISSGLPAGATSSFSASPIDEALKLVVAPAGKPDAESAIEELKLPEIVVVIVEMPELPRSEERRVGNEGGCRLRAGGCRGVGR